MMIKLSGRRISLNVRRRIKLGGRRISLGDRRVVANDCITWVIHKTNMSDINIIYISNYE